MHARWSSWFLGQIVATNHDLDEFSSDFTVDALGHGCSVRRRYGRLYLPL
jgi:hypothetical protein